MIALIGDPLHSRLEHGPSTVNVAGGRGIYGRLATPRLAVLYAIPQRYTVEPRLSTLVINAKEAAALNKVVQIYAREALFYRADRPEITEEFRRGKHLTFSSSRNFVEDIVHEMPGVPDRCTSLDFLADMLAERPPG